MFPSAEPLRGSLGCHPSAGINVLISSCLLVPLTLHLLSKIWWRLVSHYYDFSLSGTHICSKHQLLVWLLNSAGNEMHIWWCTSFHSCFRCYWKSQIRQKSRSEVWRQRTLLASQDPRWSIKASGLQQTGGCWSWIREGIGWEVVSLQSKKKKKKSKTETCSVSSWHLKKNLNDELVALISLLYPTLWIFLSYLKNCSFIFQEYIRAGEFSHRQKHYTYLQMSYIMMWILCIGMFWWKVETMQQFPICFISYHAPK